MITIEQVSTALTQMGRADLIPQITESFIEEQEVLHNATTPEAIAGALIGAAKAITDTAEAFDSNTVGVETRINQFVYLIKVKAEDGSTRYLSKERKFTVMGSDTQLAIFGSVTKADSCAVELGLNSSFVQGINMDVLPNEVETDDVVESEPATV